MYEGTQGCEKVQLPVHLNSKFIIGPEGAHLNISGISGLAAKTSYAMFLLKAIQDQYLAMNDEEDSLAFVLFNGLKKRKTEPTSFINLSDLNRSPSNRFPISIRTRSIAANRIPTYRATNLSKTRK